MEGTDPFDPYLPTLPPFTPDNYDHDLFREFTFDDTAWPDQLLLDDNSTGQVFHATNPTPAQENLYQPFLSSPNPLPRSYADFPGPSNSTQPHGQFSYQGFAEPSVGAAHPQEPVGEDLDDGEEELLAEAADQPGVGKRARTRNFNWDVHQETLRKLYLDEDKTLDEVRQIMQEQHGFDPTSPLGIAVAMAPSTRPEVVTAPIPPSPRRIVVEGGNTHDKSRQLTLAWNGMPKSELDTLYQTARAAHHRRESDLAHRLYSKALEGFLHIVGPIAEETIRVVHAFASLHLEQGNNARAYDLLQDSVQAHVSSLGVDSDQTLHYALDVANLLSACNREDDAITFLRSVHGLLRDSQNGRETEQGPSNGKVSLPSIGELIAAAEAATQSSDPASLEFSMGVARNARKAGEPAAEALLLAIISHCEYDPERLGVQRLKAWADIIDLYSSRNEIDRNFANYNSTISKAEGAFNATMKLRPWRQADKKDFTVLKACVKLAKSFLVINEHARAERMFDRICTMTERLFGLGDHAIAILIEIGKLYQDKNGWSSSRLWFEHALANAMQELPEKDGIRLALEAAVERGHFCYCDDDGEPYQTMFDVLGLTIRPTGIDMGF
ncbi:hypothetical protein PRZ48_010507 [Zasmidium cellare]|uniref:Clr5 domain-containing protein n=1 Tax=Zasmidium cellare TaxID=395010 RepID=A0ABR0E8T9_ZASCE|nr:hypothetical protein PRZ48_010507 [Zasmidium cellare]